MLDGISDPETQGYLAKEPLGSLKFRPQTSLGGTNTNGWYDPPTKQLEVTMNLSGQFGRPLVPGQRWGTWESAHTERAARQVVLRHEIGHHIHTKGGRGTPIDQVVQSAYARAQASGTHITRYAKQNRAEYFAESYAAYYAHRPVLQQHDPNGFAMVEDVLRLRGIIP